MNIKQIEFEDINKYIGLPVLTSSTECRILKGFEVNKAGIYILFADTRNNKVLSYKNNLNIYTCPELESFIEQIEKEKQSPLHTRTF